MHLGRRFDPEKCGLFYSVNGSQTPMPLDGVHVAVRIVNFVAEVQVVQFYGRWK